LALACGEKSQRKRGATIGGEIDGIGFSISIEGGGVVSVGKKKPKLTQRGATTFAFQRKRGHDFLEGKGGQVKGMVG